MDSVIVAKIDQFINLVQQTAPEVWAILIRQSITEGLFGFCISLVSLVIVITSIFSLLAMAKIGYHNWSDAQKTKFPIMVVMGFVFLCVLLAWIGDIRMLINPEFYSIKFLLSAIK